MYWICRYDPSQDTNVVLAEEESYPEARGRAQELDSGEYELSIVCPVGETNMVEVVGTLRGGHWWEPMSGPRPTYLGREPYNGAIKRDKRQNQWSEG